MKKKIVEAIICFVLLFLIFGTICLIDLPKSPQPIIVKISVIGDNGNWSGTGFFVKDDLIMTAGHITKDATSIIIEFMDGKKIIGLKWSTYLDKGLDIGFIKVITPKQEEKVKFSTIEVGQYIKVVGCPLDYYNVIVDGKVCAVKVPIEFFGNGLYIISDCHTYFGNSGSPVLDKNNKVIGILIGVTGNLGVIIPINESMLELE